MPNKVINIISVIIFQGNNIESINAYKTIAGALKNEPKLKSIPKFLFTDAFEKGQSYECFDKKQNWHCFVTKDCVELSPHSNFEYAYYYVDYNDGRIKHRDIRGTAKSLWNDYLEQFNVIYSQGNSPSYRVSLANDGKYIHVLDEYVHTLPNAKVDQESVMRYCLMQIDSIKQTIIDSIFELFSVAEFVDIIQNRKIKKLVAAKGLGRDGTLATRVVNCINPLLKKLGYDEKGNFKENYYSRKIDLIVLISSIKGATSKRAIDLIESLGVDECARTIIDNDTKRLMRIDNIGQNLAEYMHVQLSDILIKRGYKGTKRIVHSILHFEKVKIGE